MSDSFAEIKDIIQSIYVKIKENQKGKVADYIPQLASVNPDLFAISICSTAGEIFELGDTDHEYCLQSCSKPLNYCLARMLNDGGNDVHSHVGYEPSGRSFNSFALNKEGLPHNPMINAGAIMVSSLILPDAEPSGRFNKVQEFYEKMGNSKTGFDNGVFLSEKHHADRNISLAYYMRENDAFKGQPSPNFINETLDLYFQCCSVTINTKIGSIIAANLANHGINPITQEKIIEKDIVRDCLSLMFSSGMYDFSGQFSFEIGLPAKSGVSGCLLLVIPNKYGICLYSPRLDTMGNTVKGIEFSKEFSRTTNFRYHVFNNIHPKEVEIVNEDVMKQKLIIAASTGNLAVIKNINNMNIINLSDVDYDGRSALHLACAEGKYDVVEYLLNNNVKITQKDRWGNTPYHEAHKASLNSSHEEYQKIVQLLKKHIDNEPDTKVTEYPNTANLLL